MKRAAEETTADLLREAIREIVRSELAAVDRDRGPRLLTLREAGVTRRLLSRLAERGLIVVKLGRELRVEAASFGRIVAESIVKRRPVAAKAAENTALNGIDPSIRGAFLRAAGGGTYDHLESSLVACGPCRSAGRASPDRCVGRRRVPRASGDRAHARGALRSSS